MIKSNAIERNNAGTAKMTHHMAKIRLKLQVVAMLHAMVDLEAIGITQAIERLQEARPRTKAFSNLLSRVFCRSCLPRILVQRQAKEQKGEGPDIETRENSHYRLGAHKLSLI